MNNSYKILSLTFLSLVFLSACQKSETTPNRSVAGEQIVKADYYLYNPTNNGYNQSVKFEFGYDNASNLNSVRKSIYSSSPQRISQYYVDTFIRNSSGNLTKLVEDIYDPVSLQPIGLQSYTMSIFYNNSNRVALITNTLRVNQFQYERKDSILFSYGNTGNVDSLIRFYTRAAQISYDFKNKIIFSYDPSGEITGTKEYTNYRNLINSNLELLSSTIISQFDGAKKYFHDFNFVDMWAFSFVQQNNIASFRKLHPNGKFEYIDNYFSQAYNSTENTAWFYGTNNRPDSSITTTISAQSQSKIKAVYTYR
jgi:hypothetical protein